VLIAGHDRFPTYYGAEFTGQLVDLWAYHHGVRIDFSRRGKPTDNAFIETFNGTLRDECLNLHWFDDLAQASALIEAWRRDYNRASYYPSGYVIEKLRFCWRESCPAGV
jgi:transposase InsO family protein